MIGGERRRSPAAVGSRTSRLLGSCSRSSDRGSDEWGHTLPPPSPVAEAVARSSKWEPSGTAAPRRSCCCHRYRRPGRRWFLEGSSGCDHHSKRPDGQTRCISMMVTRQNKSHISNITLKCNGGLQVDGEKIISGNSGPISGETGPDWTRITTDELLPIQWKHLACKNHSISSSIQSLRSILTVHVTHMSRLPMC